MTTVTLTSFIIMIRHVGLTVEHRYQRTKSIGGIKFEIRKASSDIICNQSDMDQTSSKKGRTLPAADRSELLFKFAEIETKFHKCRQALPTL